MIDVARPSYGWMIALAALVVLGSSIPIAASIIQRVGTLRLSRGAPAKPPETRAAPTATGGEPSASTPVATDREPAKAAADTSSVATESSSARRKTGLPTAPLAKAPNGRVSNGQITVSGRLEPAVVRGVVGANSTRFRMCYEQGLGRLPTLAGRVAVRFVIGRDGAVSNVSDGGSDLADAAAKACVIRAFYGLSFPAPAGGIVTVSYPLLFRPA